MNTGVCTIPWPANAPYADVSESSVTSPVPSASDGTLGGVPTFSFSAYETAVGMPTVDRSCTAARLLEIFSADRIVISLAVEWPSSGIHAPWAVAIGASRFEITDAGE